MDKRKKILREIRSWVIMILCAFILAFFIESEVVAKVTVNQSSMENTLFADQQLLVNVFSYKFGSPKRGDIIIFFPEEENGSIMDKFNRYIDGYVELFTREEKHERYVKRVIGVEGDEVDIQDGSVYINGERLEEPYVNGRTEPKGYKLPCVVGKNEIFVMGDHRTVSEDSRSFGPINIKQVEGKAFFRIYPFNKMGKIK